MEQQVVKSLNFKEIIQSALSVEQLKKYFPKLNVISRTQMSSMKTLADVFDNYQSDHVIIFTATETEYSGHFQCMFINSGNLFFFDSYGMSPDELVTQLNYKFNQKPVLTTLINNSQYRNRAYENEIEYQGEGNDINTCGRYCLTVLIMNLMFQQNKKPFTLIELYYIMNKLKKDNQMSYDEIVSYFIDQV